MAQAKRDFTYCDWPVRIVARDLFQARVCFSLGSGLLYINLITRQTQRVWFVLFNCRPAFAIVSLSACRCRLSLQISPFLNFLKFYVVCSFTYRSARLFTLYSYVVFVPQIFKCNLLHDRRRDVILRKSVFMLSTQGIKILLSFILILRCCLVAIKEAVLFFSCFWKFLVFPCVPVLPCLACGCLTPFMPLSGCLRLAILVGFPRSPSQFSLILCP